MVSNIYYLPWFSCYLVISNGSLQHFSSSSSEAALQNPTKIIRRCAWCETSWRDSRFRFRRRVVFHVAFFWVISCHIMVQPLGIAQSVAMFCRLVVWNILIICPFSWECHHPNWRTYIFQRGSNHQPVRVCWGTLKFFVHSWMCIRGNPWKSCRIHEPSPYFIPYNQVGY